MQTVQVGLEDRGYTIEVGHDIMAQLGAYCTPLQLGRQVAVLTDKHVAGHYLTTVSASLKTAGYEVLEVIFDGGDGAKHLQTMDAIFGQLIEAELDRSAWICALGGGVVGDMSGFVAATFLRGIAYVQVPTTIVSQVDASIGGKTAVNHRLGKNLIGAFHQPRLVYIDTAALHSLPRRELVGGLAEIVKHALIRDAELFTFLEEHIEDIVERRLDAQELDWLIARNVQIKATVIEADEKEGGLRAILNYGHTVGHAIEAAAEYQYRHGEAVILGMIAAGQIAVERNLWPQEARRRQDDLLARLGIPQGLTAVSVERIVERTHADKKRVGGKSKFILPRQIGRVEIIEGIDDDEVRASVEYVQKNHP
jgi:3-dehydroquinate synthase